MKCLRFCQYLILMIGVSFAIAACQPNSNHRSLESAPSTPSLLDDCRMISHAQGETEICGQPQRIAVLGPFVLEPLIALGIQPIAFADQAAWHQGDYDQPSQQIPYLGEYITNSLTNVGLAYQPSIETLIKVQPDLILGVDFNNAEQYEVLSEIAPTLLLKWDETETNVTKIAKAAGHPEKARPLIAEMKRKIETIKANFLPFVEDHSDILLLSSSQLSEIYLGNTAHGLCSSLLVDLGFNLVAPEGVRENKPGMPVPISLETLTQMKDADAIILLGSNLNELQTPDSLREQQLAGLKQAWADNAIAQSLDASKAGRVYFIPAYLCLGLPGPIGTELYLEELKEQLLSAPPS